MLFAIDNTAVSATLSNGNPASNPNDVVDYTFDTSVSSSATTNLFYVRMLCPAGLEDYVGIAGHNLGTLGATITFIFNRDISENISYSPVDDRPIMLPITPTVDGGSGNIISIEIEKSSPTDVVVISHVAVGHTSSLTSTTTHGQIIERDYQAGFGLAAMNVARKARVTLNNQAAPTATLLKTVSTMLSLKIDNVARNFAQNELLQYQKFWVNNSFFVQFDGDITQSIMAMNFIPSAPKAHPSSRELVNLSYKFQAYNGQ